LVKKKNKRVGQYLRKSYRRRRASFSTAEK